MLIEYIAANNMHNLAEIRGAKMLMSSRDSYLNTLVGFRSAGLQLIALSKQELCLSIEWAIKCTQLFVESMNSMMS